MSFKSLHQALLFLNEHESWQTQRQFQQLLISWPQLVGAAVAPHTRPVSIQQQVLQVATSSPVWAQNLTFERHRLLEKLNAAYQLPLTDIRFSAALWHRSSSKSHSTDSTLVWDQHPSRIPPVAGTVRSQQDTPVEAFQQWASVMRARSQHLPHCPRCQCPTPVGELERWSMCALCAAKQWSSRA
jgi:predicted nucleic acid-binding Zn ribbon protein